MQEKAAAESTAATALSNVCAWTRRWAFWIWSDRPSVRVSRVWQVLSVPAACKFMEANPVGVVEEKKAFLLEKGVPEFTIAQAACTAPDTTLVL